MSTYSAQQLSPQPHARTSRGRPWHVRSSPCPKCSRSPGFALLLGQALCEIARKEPPLKYAHFAGLCLCACMLLCVPASASADGYVFMYRTNASGDDARKSDLDVVGTKWWWEESPTQAKRASGDPYKFEYREFDGNDLLRANSPISVDTTNGVTISAWFRVASFGGQQVIFSNANSGGFFLRLEDDKLVGGVYAAGAYQKVSAPNPLKINRWYHATFTTNFSFGMLVTVIKIDGETIGVKVASVGSNLRVVNSSLPPMIGAEPTANGGATSYFHGDVHQVTVRNYGLLLEEYNTYHWFAGTYDGSEGQGTPGYFDYDWEQGPDERLQSKDDYRSDLVQPVAFVPFTNDEYVVQGVASSCEGGQTCDKAKEKLYLSMYWNDGSVDEPAELAKSLGNRSLIVELDVNNDLRMTRCFRIGYASGVKDVRYSHAGGLAFYKDNLYLSGSSSIVRFDLSQASGPSSKCTELAPKSSRAVLASDFVSLHVEETNFPEGRPTLIVGDYSKTDVVPVAYMYELNTITGDLRAQDGDYVPAFALPWRAQGVDIVGKDMLVSLNRNMMRYSLNAMRCDWKLANGKWVVSSCPSPSNPLADIDMPQGGEDLAYANGRLWSASESSARVYQRVKDMDFFPFIYFVRPTENDFP